MTLAVLHDNTARLVLRTDPEERLRRERPGRADRHEPPALLLQGRRPGHRLVCGLSAGLSKRRHAYSSFVTCTRCSDHWIHSCRTRWAPLFITLHLKRTREQTHCLLLHPLMTFLLFLRWRRGVRRLCPPAACPGRRSQPPLALDQHEGPALRRILWRAPAHPGRVAGLAARRWDCPQTFRLSCQALVAIKAPGVCLFFPVVTTLSCELLSCPSNTTSSADV